MLPSDLIVAAERTADAPHEVVAADAIPADRMGLDIGPESARLFAASIRGAGTVFWNGPMGVFELEPFAAGARGRACRRIAWTNPYARQYAVQFWTGPVEPLW